MTILEKSLKRDRVIVLRNGLVAVVVAVGAVACSGTLAAPDDDATSDQSLVGQERGYRPQLPNGDGGSAPNCFTQSQGSATSCKAPELWTLHGSSACRAKGATITQVKFTSACGGGNYRGATYECCDSAAGPSRQDAGDPGLIDAGPWPSDAGYIPPSDAGSLQDSGSETVISVGGCVLPFHRRGPCITIAAWEQQAAQLCAPTGLRSTIVLTEAASCNPNTYSGVAMGCCPR